MTLKEDMIARIITDFGENASTAATILIASINKVDYLKNDRVIRCIIFLAKGELTELKHYILAATVETRDVIFWAEHERLKENENPIRVRDFNKTFTDCTIVVNE